ncbi:MAG: YciI family protein [Balneolaceae bacterium]
MNKYMLILFEHENAYADFSPEEMQKEIAAHGQWIQELGEHYDSGEPLHQPAKTIIGKDKITTDGPFIESKELVSGFYILNASSFDEATELAKGCPVLRLGGKVEVREVMKF